jgi:hypothetical protein
VAESIARKAIMQELKDMFPHRYIIQEGEMPKLGKIPATRWFTQPVAWIFGAVVLANPYKHSELQIGYTLGDQIMVYRTELQNVWNNLSLITLGEVVPLMLPLMLQTKATTVQYLPKKLRDLIWVCELPVVTQKRRKEIYTPCGQCAACVTFAAITDPENTGKTNSVRRPLPAPAPREENTFATGELIVLPKKKAKKSRK